MNIEQLSTQIVAINDAIQILARSNTTVVSHSKEIDSILKTQKDYGERVREIESLIHQSCDIKSKEMSEQSKEFDNKLGKVYDRAFQYAWQFSAVVGGVGLGMFYYTFSSIEQRESAHAQLEASQDAKADKVFSEISAVMREIKNNLSDMKSDMAVIKSEQKYYQTQLSGHMNDEERRWEGKH